MRLIAVEEHTSNAAINRAARAVMKQAAPNYYKGLRPELPYFPGPGQMADLGEKRLADLDANGIDMQVLISGGSMWMPPEQAVPLAQAANDELAAAVSLHPDRYAAFAVLPTCAPDAAARELERAEKMGFRGAAIIGRPGETFLDDLAYAPILEAASRRSMPLYLHPGLPIRSVQQAYYEGLDPVVSGRLLSFGWGWHAEAGVQLILLILSGAFDRWPGLQVITGHWGEMVPFFLDRLDESLPPEATGLSRTISETFREHIYVMPSGMFSVPQLLFTLQVLGADHILFSVDYPFVPNAGARAFLEHAPISEGDREKIAHKNAEQLLRLSANQSYT